MSHTLPRPDALLRSALFPLLLCAYAVFLTCTLWPHQFGDDAAISFRYVDRIAEGRGFTYNDHERVIGASNPLYILLLVAARLWGVSAEDAAYLVYYAVLFVTPLVAYGIASKLTNRFYGFLTALALVTHGHLRGQMSNGLETGLSVLIGLAVLHAVSRQNQTLVGVLLGLAVWNKLDGGMLALAVAGAWLIVHRKFPWRAAVVSLLVVLPWFLFSLFSTGSPFPQSMATKLVEHSASFGGHYDHYWVAKLVAREYNFFLLLLAVSPIVLIRRYAEPSQLVVLVSALWFLFHGAAYTLLNFGDPYPWYLAVLIVPLVVLAGTALHVPFGATALPSRRWRLLLAAALLALFAVPCVWQFRYTVMARIKAGNPVPSWQLHDLDRRVAGIFLEHFAEEGEVATAAWGWPAYQYRKGPFHDGSHLCSRDIAGEIMYQVRSGDPVPPLPGYEVLADFDLASAIHGKVSRFAVLGHPNSAIARKGIRYRRLQPIDLPPPEPYSGYYDMKHFEIGEPRTSVFAHAPTGFVYTFKNDQPLGVPDFVYFRPTFAEHTPASKTNGVVFRVLIDDDVAFERHLTPLEEHALVKLEVPERSSVSLSFVTDPGPGGDTGWDWSWWHDLEFVFVEGEIELDLSTVHDADLRRIWAERNPIVGSVDAR